MTEFSATDAALEGFRVTRENLRAIGIWAVVEFAFSVLNVIVLVSLGGAAFHRLAGLAPDDMMKLGPSALNDIALGLVPAYLAVLPLAVSLQTLLTCAIYRAASGESAGRLGFLQIGKTEFRTLGATLLIGLVLTGCYIGGVLAVTLVLVIGKEIGGEGLAGLVAFVGLGTLICGLIYLYVRLTLAVPLAFQTGRIDIKAAFRASSGRFWTFLGVYLMALLLGLLVAMLGGVINLVVQHLLSTAWRQAGDLLTAKDLSLATVLHPIVLAATLVGAVIGTLFRVIVTAPSYALYRALQTKF